jgi:tetrahydromethanopterin S-methyltransferase subunit G
MNYLLHPEYKIYLSENNPLIAEKISEVDVISQFVHQWRFDAATRQYADMAIYSNVCTRYGQRVDRAELTPIERGLVFLVHDTESRLWVGNPMVWKELFDAGVLNGVTHEDAYLYEGWCFMKPEVRDRIVDYAKKNGGLVFDWVDEYEKVLEEIEEKVMNLAHEVEEKVMEAHIRLVSIRRDREKAYAKINRIKLDLEKRYSETTGEIFAKYGDVAVPVFISEWIEQNQDNPSCLFYIDRINSIRDAYDEITRRLEFMVNYIYPTARDTRKEDSYIPAYHESLVPFLQNFFNFPVTYSHQGEYGAEFYLQMDGGHCIHIGDHMSIECQNDMGALQNMTQRVLQLSERIREEGLTENNRIRLIKTMEDMERARKRIIAIYKESDAAMNTLRQVLTAGVVGEVEEEDVDHEQVGARSAV